MSMNVPAGHIGCRKTAAARSLASTVALIIREPIDGSRRFNDPGFNDRSNITKETSRGNQMGNEAANPTENKARCQ
jgi:hypothetical protein